MILNLSYDHNFVELINRMRIKYSEEIFSVDGISEDQLDVAKFSKKFMTSDNTSNASIDANGNVDGINMATYTKEVGKPIAKFNGYFLMWKELKEVYGLDVANEAIESTISGDVYVHDSTNFSLPYCFNYTAYDVVLKGLPSWTGIGKKTAPKTLLAYTEQVKNLLISVGSMQLGATGIADFLIFFSWFVERNLKGIHTEGGLNKADFEGREDLWEQRVWEDSKQILTTWIYNINDNYRGDQTLFTNISLYDNYFLENLLGEINMHEAPYKIDKTVVMQVQKMFVETMNEELKRTPLTYPVTTATFTRYDEEEITLFTDEENASNQVFNQFDKVDKKVGFRLEKTLVTDIKVGDIVGGFTVINIERVIIEKNKLRDTEFVKYIAKENLPYQFINMFNGESSVLSSCCFVGDEMISVNNTETDKTELISIKDFVGQYGDENLIKKPISKKYTIESLNPETLEYENGIDIVSVLKKPYGGKLYQFTVDGNEIEVTEDHIFLVMNIETNKTEEVRADKFDKEIHLLPINE